MSPNHPIADDSFRSDPQSNRTVVLVGHCGFDSGGLTRVIRHAIPGANVESTHGLEELERYADDRALLLINRIPEGTFGGRDGIALIKHLTERGGDIEAKPRAMLISNYADSQASAEAAGAFPGFGKSEMGTDKARQRLRDALKN
ncbi:MAG: hypothetical protein AAGJ38_02235 [Planctomycetota bacterium]